MLSESIISKKSLTKRQSDSFTFVISYLLLSLCIAKDFKKCLKRTNPQSQDSAAALKGRNETMTKRIRERDWEGVGIFSYLCCSLFIYIYYLSSVLLYNSMTKQLFS